MGMNETPPPDAATLAHQVQAIRHELIGMAAALEAQRALLLLLYVGHCREDVDTLRQVCDGLAQMARLGRPMTGGPAFGGEFSAELSAQVAAYLEQFKAQGLAKLRQVHAAGPG